MGKYLKNKRLYLSGAIEHGTDDNWRDEPKKKFNDLGIHVFDPFDDPKQQWVPSLTKARQEKDYSTIAKIAKNFVRKDLCLVDRADFLVAYLPYKIPTCGTHHEIINSNNAKKPTLLVSDQNDIGYIPTWYFGFIPPEFMFPNWDSLYEYLESVDRGEHLQNDRWHYVYGMV